MKTPYPTADGPLLAAVKAAMLISGNSADAMSARSRAEKAIIALCPYAIDSVQQAQGHYWAGRHFKLESIEVYRGMHHADNRASSWSWVLRGPLILKAGKLSRINSVRSHVEFHVEIPWYAPIPGDAGY